MRKLLFVEDDPDTIESLKELVEKEGLLEQEPMVTNFEKAIDTIKDFRPDVVILDLFDGDPLSGKSEGWKFLDFIRDEHFCPVIVYSAMPEEPEDKKHPLIYYVKKGSRSERLVLKELREIEPHIGVLREVEEYVYKTYSSTVSTVVPYAFDIYDENDQRVDVVKRAARRRLAAQVDELLSKDDKLASWEQYIFPPISEEFRLGDVLRKKACDSSTPEAFRIVLTPSCDLQRYGGERKVEEVLVSRCCPMKEGIKKSAIDLAQTKKKEAAGDKKKKKERNEKKIGTLLSQGHSNGIIPLPPLKNIIPSMAANLRDLQLIQADVIGDSELADTVEYVRVASLDSPFREMVSWAYLQIAGRPGLPNRNFDKWIEEILEECLEECS